MANNYPSRWKKQIENLISQVPNVRPIGFGNDHWAISALDPNKKVLFTIHIYLDPRFPVTAPLIYVEPAPGMGIQHAWINSENFIFGHPKLYEWNYQNKIGNIVADILYELKTKPPNIFKENPSSNSQNTQNRKAPLRSTRAPYLPLPTSIPDLYNLKLQELKLILENENLLRVIIYDHSEVKNSLDQLFLKLLDIASLITNNEDKLKEMQIIENKLYSICEVKQTNLNRLYELMHKFNSQVTQEGTGFFLNLIDNKVQKILIELKENKSNIYINDWETFSSNYLRLKKHYHKLVAIKEKLTLS